MTEKVINKTLRTRSIYDMNERIKSAEKSGYEIVGKVVVNSDGCVQSLMRKVIYWEERK